MNINDKATRQGIVERYLNAETSLEEEKALYEFYSHTKETLSDDEKMVCQLVLSTTNLTDDFELSDEKTEAFDRIMNEQDKRSSRRIIWPWFIKGNVRNSRRHNSLVFSKHIHKNGLRLLS